MEASYLSEFIRKRRPEKYLPHIINGLIPNVHDGGAMLDSFSKILIIIDLSEFIWSDKINPNSLCPVGWGGGGGY